MRPLLILFATLTAISIGNAQDTSGQARGYVRALDADNGTITLSLLTGKSKVEYRLKTFNLLKPDIPVQNQAGRPLKLRDVEEDALVTLKLNSEDDVVGIVTSLPTLTGILWRIEPKERLLVVKSALGERAVQVPADAKVLYSNSAVTFESLKSGGNISVLYSDDPKKVLEVRMGKGVVALPKPLKSMGTLIDIDHDKQFARIFAAKSMGDWYTLHETPLSRGATFTLMFVGRPLREIPSSEVIGPLTGTYWTEPVTSKLVHFDLEMPVLNQRTVKAIDMEKRLLTIVDRTSDKSFSLSAHVRIANKAGKAVELRAGAVVNIGLHPNRRQVEAIVVSK
jgi:hypothetical protein